MENDKVRENRLRRMAERQGYQLVKSKARDPRAIDYGGWMVTSTATSEIVAGGHGYLTVDEVEKFLREPGWKPSFAELRSYNLVPSGPRTVVALGNTGWHEYDLSEDAGNGIKVQDYVIERLLNSRWRGTIVQMIAPPGTWQSYVKAQENYDQISAAADVIAKDGGAESLARMEVDFMNAFAEQGNYRLPSGVDESYYEKLISRREEAKLVLFEAYKPIQAVIDEAKANIIRTDGDSSEGWNW